MGADPRFYRLGGPVTAGALAERVGGWVVGDPDRAVSNVASAGQAGEADLYFLSSDPGALDRARGVAIVADADLAARLAEAGAGAIVHPGPKAAYAQAASSFVGLRAHVGPDRIDPAARIEETASVGPGVVVGADARIAAGAQIGANAVIGPGVEIGAATRVGAGAVIQCAIIGSRCEIAAGSVIGESGFGLAYHEGDVVSLPHVGRVVIEDDVTLGANVTVDRGMFSDTVLKRGCRIDNLSHVAHNVLVGERAVMAAFAGISGSVTIGSGAQFGGRVGVADHLAIGDGARLAADAAVMRDVPAGETWAGSPAQPIQRFMRETAWVRRESGRSRRKAKPAAGDET